MAAHQALPCLGFSRQEHWSGLPFPSPMHESEKWKWSHSVVSNSATPWTAAYQAPPSMGFSRQEYWSGVPLPSPVKISSSIIFLGFTLCCVSVETITHWWLHKVLSQVSWRWEETKFPVRQRGNGDAMKRDAGSQREEFQPRQGHAARVIRPQVFPLEFPEHPPPKNKNLPAFPLLWYSLEKVNSGL